MKNEFLDGDTLFAVAVAGAIALGTANLAIQVNKEVTKNEPLSTLLPPAKSSAN